MKTINISGQEYPLTPERIRRITSAMIETQDKLNKELRYSEDLQKPEMIAFYRSHLDKLSAMLN